MTPATLGRLNLKLDPADTGVLRPARRWLLMVKVGESWNPTQRNMTSLAPLGGEHVVVMREGRGMGRMGEEE
jgi:hypothetical protein